MNFALLVLRLVVGLVIASHGAQKLFGVFGGHGVDGTAAYYEQLGLRPARLNVWIAGVAEFAGGLLIAVGFLTPFAAAAVIGIMTVAVLTVHLRNGLFVTENGFEYNLVLAAVALSLAGVGAGSWSLDNAFGSQLTGAGWALAALAAGVLGGLGVIANARQTARQGGTEGQPHAA
jgi:putative oxidoreductase